MILSMTMRAEDGGRRAKKDLEPLIPDPGRNTPDSTLYTLDSALPALSKRSASKGGLWTLDSKENGHGN